MDIQYSVRGSITVSPIGYDDFMPEIVVRMDREILFDGLLDKRQTILIDRRFDRSKSHQLCVEFLNKTDSDTDLANNRDKAVIIEEIEFFGIKSPQFVWAGVYRPMYPPHVRDQPEVLKYHNYLGWNGIWCLDFTVPIFTWIHHVENLGWIYD